MITVTAGFSPTSFGWYCVLINVAFDDELVVIMAAPTPSELTLVNQVFAVADPQKLGIITGEAALAVFAGTKLTPGTLGEIWSISDSDNNGFLTRKDLLVALRLIGHAQKGEKLSSELVNKRKNFSALTTA